jgi:hypothetical protein
MQPIKYYFDLWDTSNGILDDGDFFCWVRVECHDPNFCSKASKEVQKGRIFSPFESEALRHERNLSESKLKADLDLAGIPSGDGNEAGVIENVPASKIVAVLEAAGWTQRYIPIGP